MALKDIREKQARLVTEARSKLDEITDSTPEARAAEIQTEHDAIMAEYDRLEERHKREERLADAERIIDAPDPRRPVEDRAAKKPENDQEARAEAHKDAFRSYLRGGLESCSPEQRQMLREMTARETRDQTVGTTTEGGYTVPTGFMAELVLSLKAYGPMLDPGVTRQIDTASGNALPWPGLNDTANKGRRITELTQSDLTGASGAKPALGFNQRNLYAWKYTSDVFLVSAELLQDSALNVEAIVRDAMAERIGRIANEELTTGSGSGSSMPQGIATGAGAGATAAGASAITFDDVIELYHSVDPAYRSDPSCKFMFNDATLKALRKLKDGDGSYIWQPASVVAAAPATILGQNYAINQDMASIATGNTSMLFGAMNRYVVRKVKEFAVRRLVERYADYDAVGFIGFMRMDGNILDNAAIKKLAHP